MITTEHFQIRAPEVDRHKRATVSALISYMQEAAWTSAASLGASVDALQEMGISWVLVRFKLEILAYPKHRDNITVLTWPSGHERTFVYRDYRIQNEQGETIARATSTWLVLDLTSRKMIGVPEPFHGILNTPNEREPMPRAKDRLRMPTEFEHRVSFPVRWHDLDNNDHVSNFLYFQWPLEALSADWLANKNLSSIDLMIRSESVLGDTIVSTAAQIEANQYMHSIKREADGKELARALTVWR